MQMTKEIYQLPHSVRRIMKLRKITKNGLRRFFFPKTEHRINPF